MDDKIVELQKEVTDLGNRVAYMTHAVKGISTDMRLLKHEVKQIRDGLERYEY